MASVLPVGQHFTDNKVFHDILCPWAIIVTLIVTKDLTFLGFTRAEMEDQRFKSKVWQYETVDLELEHTLLGSTSSLLASACMSCSLGWEVLIGALGKQSALVLWTIHGTSWDVTGAHYTVTKCGPLVGSHASGMSNCPASSWSLGQ